MTDDDLPVRDRPVPRKRTVLDELHRWRWYSVFVTIVLTVLLGIYVYAGTPGLDLLLMGSAVALGAAGVAGIVGLPFALILAQEPEQRALVYLNNKGELDFGVEYFSQEEWDALTVRWGQLKDLEGTNVPAAMALVYDKQSHAAWGTHRAVMDPDDLEAVLYLTEEIYGDQEEELAQLRQLRFLGRSLVRKGLDRQLDENNKLYDDLTLPAGDTVGDVWKEMRDEKPDRVVDDNLDPNDVKDDDQEDVDEMDQEDVDDLADYLSDATSEPERPAAPDGGQDDG